MVRVWHLYLFFFQTKMLAYHSYRDMDRSLSKRSSWPEYRQGLVSSLNHIFTGVKQVGLGGGLGSEWGASQEGNAEQGNPRITAAWKQADLTQW